MACIVLPEKVSAVNWVFDTVQYLNLLQKERCILRKYIAIQLISVFS